MQVELTSTPANSTIPTLSSSGSADGSASPFAALLQDHTPKGAAEAVALQSKDVQPETPQAKIQLPGQSLIPELIARVEDLQVPIQIPSGKRAHRNGREWA